jgi:hypothetical protein
MTSRSRSLFLTLIVLTDAWVSACGSERGTNSPQLPTGGVPSTGDTAGLGGSWPDAGSETTATATGGAEITGIGGESNTGGTPPGAGGISQGTGGVLTSAATASGGNSVVSGEFGGASIEASGGSPLATGGTTAQSGGDSNAGGDAGTGGDSCASGWTKIYDFSVDTQGWEASDEITLSTSGGHLVATTPAIGSEGTSFEVAPTQSTSLTSGSVITFNVRLSGDVSKTWIKTFAFVNGWKYNDSGNSKIIVNAGGWTSWTYTMPEIFPGGLQQLGLNLGNVEAGDIVIDSITACSPTYTCAGSATFDWESGSSDWTLSNTSNVVASQTSSGLAFTGSGSLQVELTNFPSLDSTELVLSTLDKQPYCGQEITYHVWVPADLDANIAIKPFASINDWTWDTHEAAIVPGQWNAITYCPQTIGILGVQQLGLQIRAGTLASPYTGNIFIDAVSWDATK